MKKHLRKVLKWVMWIVSFLLFLLLLQVSALAFPQPWFDRPVQSANLKLYSKGIPRAEMQSIVDEVHRRVSAAEIYDEEAALRVFVCSNPRLYNMFARLSLVPAHVPGFNLSIFNNTFVSTARLDERRSGTFGVLEHTALSGELEHCIAHELVHDYTQQKIGTITYRRLPRWKTEGYAEYAAGRAFLDARAGTSLNDRITTLQQKTRGENAREYYRWGLVVEFLAVERGYSFDQIMDDAVTLGDADRDMMSWYNQPR